MRGSSRLSWLIAVLAVRAEALAPEFACPSNCNSQGYCHDGICVCYPGWTGADCSTLTQCPHQLSLRRRAAGPLFYCWAARATAHRQRVAHRGSRVLAVRTEVLLAFLLQGIEN